MNSTYPPGYSVILFFGTMLRLRMYHVLRTYITYIRVFFFLFFVFLLLSNSTVEVVNVTPTTSYQ